MPNNLLSDDLIHDHNDHVPYVPPCSVVVILPDEETLQEELALMDEDQIEILTPEEQSQPPASDIEGVVGQILINEHASPTGTLIYNKEGK